MISELAAELDFLQSVQNHYDGVARIKIRVTDLAVRLDGNHLRPTHATVWVKLLLGAPKIVAGQSLCPVEIPMIGAFDASRDGEMTFDEMFIFMVRGALRKISRGAAVAFMGWPTELTRGEIFLRSVEKVLAPAASNWAGD